MTLTEAAHFLAGALKALESQGVFVSVDTDCLKISCQRKSSRSTAVLVLEEFHTN